MSMPHAADRNLLFGILALQMDFISRDALIAAMNAWVLEKAQPLGQVLVAQGQLHPEQLGLLDAVVAAHLRAHHDDPQQSLASLSSVSSIRHELAALSDADVQASLASLPTPSSADPDRTADDDKAAGSRYRILRPHARGGLGQVSVAEDLELHREVALKEIQPEHADNPDSRSRFVQEAEITGNLEHPGIVPVYGLGQYDNGCPFYAMRFIKGESLKDAIQRFHAADQERRDPGERSLAWRGLLRRFLDVCNAVAYAHSRGVLHRDLKPANVMLGTYGETLLVDWGLAKVVGRPAGTAGTHEPTLRPSAGSDVAVTQHGAAIGTPAYMSPEQAAGRLEELSPASDVYSLGAVLYVLLTGASPFPGRDQFEVLSKVQRGEFLRPRQVKAAVPPALEAICLKAMALRQEERYVTATALAADLEHWLADEPVTAYREPWTVRGRRWLRRHRTAVTAAAAALLVALVSLALATARLSTANRALLEANQREQAAKETAQANF
jgi:serine/threonine-protein kinase